MKLQLLFLVIFLVKLLDAACDNGAYEWGITEDEKNQIVNAHNNFRTMIAQERVPGQPRGINLKRMQWDNNLASAAQSIANTCEFEHKSVSDGRWWWVGQNLYTSQSTNYDRGTDWDGAVTSWFNEHNIYQYGAGFSSATGHYTQVIWANSDHIGCGYIHFASSGSFPYQKLYVCNYGPGGNIAGENPYNTGSSGCENLC